MSEPTAMEKMLILANEFDRRQAEITNLRSINSDLLEALEKISLMRGTADGYVWDLVDAMEKEAQAALKKAKP